MSSRPPSVCILAQTLNYPEGGGHFWCYYNWALGFASAGFHVIWLEPVTTSLRGFDLLHRAVLQLRKRLATESTHFHIALCGENGEPVDNLAELGTLSLDEVAGRADIFINFRYGFPETSVRKFRRSVLMDIDPGLLSHWVSQGDFPLAHHNAYVSVGGNVNSTNPLVPDIGIVWEPLHPAVHLPSWPVLPPTRSTFTALSHWEANEYVKLDETHCYENTKRAAFEPFLDLPKLTHAPLELALCLARNDNSELHRLNALGWDVVHSHDVSSTPADYRKYIQSSAGEFGVAKPAYVKMKTGWISDRTVCYLASGRPCIVQDTGPIGFPNAEGLLRFKNIQEAAQAFAQVSQDPLTHSCAARKLAEDYFSAEKLARRIAELVL